MARTSVKKPGFSGKIIDFSLLLSRETRFLFYLTDDLEAIARF
ncbi:MAG: hypothetical protein AB4352_00655 [Hormoscilla sp.]